jgi:hypothetical protein
VPGRLLQKLLSERWFECIQDKENGFLRPINYCSQLLVLDIEKEIKQEMRVMGDRTGSNQGTDASDFMDAGQKVTAPMHKVILVCRVLSSTRSTEQPKEFCWRGTGCV